MILVVGGTGLLGGTIARRLLEGGEEVRVLVRHGSPYESLLEAGAQPAIGDLKEPASLKSACEGVDVVITTANSASRGGKDNVETVDLWGNRHLIDAAADAGVGHFLFVSTQGAHPNSPVPFLEAKGRSEEHLRESGMPFTIFEPDFYMDIWVPMIVLGPLQQERPVTLVGEAARKHYFVAVDDVAGYLVASIGNPDALNQTLLIGGPEPLSWSDVVATAERVLGTTPEVVKITPGEPLPGFPETISELMAGMETYDSPPPISPDEARERYGVEPTPLEEFLVGTRS